MTEEWIKMGGGCVYIYIYIYIYKERKKFAAIWMEPESTILSELSQTEAEISYKILIM